MISETPEKYIQRLLQDASEAVYKSMPEHLEVSANFSISTPKPEFGDYATNLPLVVAKTLKMKPQEIGELVAAEIRKLDTKNYFKEVTVVSGFINFTLSDDVLLKNLQNILDQRDLYGSSVNGQGKTVLVEYFANNVAKPPHIGHLRSVVIGDCLLRVLKTQGYKVVSDTHIGDWGTQFGILLYAFKTMGDKKAIEQDPVNELNKLYVAMSAEIEKQPELREKGKEEFAKLEKGDTENRELWQWFVRVSLEDFERYRDLLDVLPFDHNLGESFYEDKMPAVLEDLRSKGLLVESEGAKIVNLENQKMGVAVLVKSDGATTYLLRDLATVKYRVQEMKLEKVLYVVDVRQSHHFDQVFEICKQAGYLSENTEFKHIAFGFMSLPEGPISTRKGTVISLQNLLDEATTRALSIINEKNPELSSKESIAKLVALSAIKYFDLEHNRNTDFVFTWDKALSFEGNTGPYLQYTHARIHGILRKNQEPNSKNQTDFKIQILKFKPEELSVLRKLVQFPQILEQVSKDLLPNLLANYLFELSQTFNAFYQEVPVLKEPDEEIKDLRLKIITATAQVIQNGLYSLGIEAPEEM